MGLLTDFILSWTKPYPLGKIHYAKNAKSELIDIPIPTIMFFLLFICQSISKLCINFFLFFLGALALCAQMSKTESKLNWFFRRERMILSISFGILYYCLFYLGIGKIVYFASCRADSSYQNICVAYKSFLNSIHFSKIICVSQQNE